ncbi:hypothetical protein SJ300_08980, partial [Citrobacter portucalensis]|nr:hypothetical protein [Citrobacter portucalensis]
MIPFRFSEMTHADIPAVQSFLIEHLNLFFNAGRSMPSAEEDLFDLEQQYLLQERNLLLCAWSENQELIATLAVCQYNDRGNDSNLLIVFYVQIMPDDFVMQLHR